MRGKVKAEHDASRWRGGPGLRRLVSLVIDSRGDDRAVYGGAWLAGRHAAKASGRQRAAECADGGPAGKGLFRFVRYPSGAHRTCKRS